MKLLQSAVSGLPLLHVQLPAGTYYVGDPCYVLTEEHYQQLLGLVYGEDRFEPRNVLVEVDGAQLFNWCTIVGDGSYGFFSPQVSAPKRGLLVDSGQLALIDQRLIQRNKYSAEQLASFSALVTFAEPVTVELEANANLRSLDGTLRVIVEEDGVEEDGWDDEEY